MAYEESGRETIPASDHIILIKSSMNLPTITICSKERALDLLEIHKKKFDMIISIQDSKRHSKWEINRRAAWQNRLRKYCSNLLCLFFIDSNKAHEFGPKQYHVEELLAFLKKHGSLENKAILVHCQEGISRSTAVSMIIFRECGLSNDEARRKVTTIRSMADPNQIVLDLYEKCTDEILHEDKKKKSIISLFYCNLVDSRRAEATD